MANREISVKSFTIKRLEALIQNGFFPGRHFVTKKGIGGFREGRPYNFSKPLDFTGFDVLNTDRKQAGNLKAWKLQKGMELF
ncbi:hypothetical protein JXA40_05375 [bacterium]|nr:hypothetical protein [candidate division CSSED10-310 bacterium]